METFKARSVIGDEIEGHELLQHALLKREGLATSRRLGTEASKKNPVIALDEATHDKISAAQRSLDVAAQTARQNIEANVALLRQYGDVSRRTIQKLANKAIEHARTLGLID